MEQPVLDEGTLEELRSLAAEGGPDCLAAMMRSFLSGLTDRIIDVRDALASHDTLALATAAHSLRGTSGLFGARQMAEICAGIEECGWSGALDAVGSLVDKLHAEEQRVRQAVEREIASDLHS
jgi:HPt (histidine-containing phosphotransfer) domain-containing protein